MTLTGAVMKVLEFFHWFVCIIMAYAAFIPNKTVKLYAYFSIIMIMVSWIIFDGCILWDIQKKIDPTFDIPNDTIGHMVGVRNICLCADDYAMYKFYSHGISTE